MDINWQTTLLTLSNS